MIWLIAGIIVSIIGVIGIALLELDVNDTIDARCLLGLLGLLIVIPSFIGSVPTGNVGIKTSFGKVLDDSLSEGINLKMPWQKVVNMDLRVQKYENETTLDSSTKDMQVVTNISVSVNYQLSSDKASSLYRTVGSSYKETILEPAIQETVKSTISQYNASELVSMRTDIANIMVDTLNEKMNIYGISISSIAINNFDFSAEYNASIERKAVAEQNALASAQELEKAKIEAERKIVEAEAEKKANDLLQESLSSELIAKQFIEKWNGELPKVMGEGNIVDITGLVQ